MHGCYWHRHKGRRYATTPATRREFWLEKFQSNVERDRRNRKELQGRGWRVFVVWECALRRDAGGTVLELADALADESIRELELPREPR